MVRRLGLGKNNHLTYASLALNPRDVLKFCTPKFLTKRYMQTVQTQVRLHLWFHMWHFFGFHLFLISPFGALRGLCLMIVAPPGYLCLYFWWYLMRKNCHQKRRQIPQPKANMAYRKWYKHRNFTRNATHLIMLKYILQSISKYIHLKGCWSHSHHKVTITKYCQGR